MDLLVEIHNIKCIRDLQIVLPINPGLYALTGLNGSGKSTIVTCASSVFFDLKKDDYFGPTESDAFIQFTFDGKSKKWSKDSDNEWINSNPSTLGLQGFYEGSLIYGNRFRDTSYEKLHKIGQIDMAKLRTAPDFIRVNLGKILQGDENYYEEMYQAPFNSPNRNIYFYKKGEKLINQFYMSTGENLLVSILHSLNKKNKEHNQKAAVYYKRYKGKVIFLDEIELALHPSSLKRLVQFLQDMSNRFGYAIYFSTHSIELIGCIKPENIFYVDRHADESTSIINPCYPAYATRNLYNHEGYDKVIFVEDDLAKFIVDRLLREEKLLNSRLVHVLPCGGYINVINFAYDVINSNLLGTKTSLCMVVDGDVSKEARAYKRGKKINTPLGFLPVASLEKYLLEVLVNKVDHKLFRKLGDYIFLQKSLSTIISEYKLDPGSKIDKNGKLLFRYLSDEFTTRRITRGDLIEIVVDYWFEEKKAELGKLIDFLKDQLK